MGFIKEPAGVDFVIKSEPLTDDERKAISEFISNAKKGNLAKEKKGQQISSRPKLKLQPRNNVAGILNILIFLPHFFAPFLPDEKNNHYR